MMTIQELADMVGGTFRGGAGGGDTVISGVASLNEAGPGDVSFFHNARYMSQLSRTCAGAVLVPPGLDGLPIGTVFIEVENPSAAFGALVGKFSPPLRARKFGVHPAATVAESAEFDAEKVWIGAGAFVGEDVVLGEGTRVEANAFLGDGVKVGAGCHIHANASVREECVLGDRVVVHCNAVIGADGFGFDTVEGKHRKIPQVGIVEIGDDVEIGAGTTIDRARFGRTVVGEGTKIDNQVMIGHNCVIGRHCILVAQAGIAGSTVLGDYVTVAAKAGAAGHLRIGDRVVLMGMAGATKDIAEPGYYMGFPAQPMRQAKREMAAVRRLPELLSRLMGRRGDRGGE